MSCSYIWFGSNMILFVFTWFFIPETRDRTLEEIHEMFEAKVPARKFKSYVCTNTQAMANAAHKERDVDAIHLEDVKGADVRDANVEVDNREKLS